MSNSKEEVAARLRERAALQAAKDKAAREVDALIDLRVARQLRVDALALDDREEQVAAQAQAGETIQTSVIGALNAITGLPEVLTIAGNGGTFSLNTQTGDLFTVTQIQKRPVVTPVDQVGWCTNSHPVLSGFRSQLIALRVSGSITLPTVPPPEAAQA